jgi:hypothetical protein
MTTMRADGEIWGGGEKQFDASVELEKGPQLEEKIETIGSSLHVDRPVKWGGRIAEGPTTQELARIFHADDPQLRLPDGVIRPIEFRDGQGAFRGFDTAPF